MAIFAEVTENECVIDIDAFAIPDVFTPDIADSPSK